MSKNSIPHPQPNCNHIPEPGTWEYETDKLFPELQPGEKAEIDVRLQREKSELLLLASLIDRAISSYSMYDKLSMLEILRRDYPEGYRRVVAMIGTERVTSLPSQDGQE